ncbi:MAG: hypothetical protein AAFY84_01110 [Pseudomonadota bacterium]
MIRKTDSFPRDRTGTVETTSVAYADLLSGNIRPSENGGYLAMRAGTPIDTAPSSLARDKQAAQQLWDGSRELIASHLSPPKERKNPLR